MPTAPEPVVEDQLERRFKVYLTHNQDMVWCDRIALLHSKVKEAATAIIRNTPVCSEQVRALEALDQALFLARAAVDRGE